MPPLSEDVVAGVEELALYEILRQRLQKVIPVPSPAAGAEWTITVPAGVAWELVTILTRFVTSAVVANRLINLDVNDPDGNRIHRFGTAANVPASQTAVAPFEAGSGAFGTVTGQSNPLPSPYLVLPAGYILRSNTALLDVGDQYNATFLTVREWSIREALLNVEWIKNHAR